MQPAPVPDDPLAAVTPELAARLPAALAHRLCAVPLEHDPVARTMAIAIADPTQLDALDEITFATGLRIQAYRAAQPDLRRAIARLYPAAPPRQKAPSIPVPPLPKIQSYEESERRSKRWVQIIGVLVALGIAFPFFVIRYIRSHRNDRGGTVDERVVLEGGLCEALPHRDWFRAAPWQHDAHETEDTIELEVCTTEGRPSEASLLIAATVRSPALADDVDAFSARVLDELAEPMGGETCEAMTLRDELGFTCRGHGEQLWAWKLADDRYRVFVVRVPGTSADALVELIEGAVITD